MKSSMKKAAPKTAGKKPAAKTPAKKKVIVRGSAAKATKTPAKATGKNAAARPAKKAASKAARPVAKSKQSIRQPVKAAKPTKQETARKATPDKKAKRMDPRTALPIARPAVRVRAQAKLREQKTAKPTAQEQMDAEAHTEQDVRLPAAAFDPTPDTHVPLRGHTSFQHNAQSERAAALKGQRARIGSRRKH